MRRTSPPLHEQQRARLEAYAQARANFDTTRVHECSEETGWRVDNYEQELPAEPPGEPLPGGSFMAAQQVLRNYSFPPPNLITGVFVPETPLEQRVMVLRGRFLIFTFWFGVRIGGVVNEIRALPDGSREAVWGYNYYTLEGHFERGQIEFTVHKHLGTGRVMFRIHAVSQTGHISNLFYRVGFRIFGRFLQRRFSHESMRRVREQVEDMLLTGASTPLEPSTPLEAVPRRDVPDHMTQHLERAADGHAPDRNQGD
ncbi:DUF1990 domain-containing protein [Deinococcus deserti]|uniref:DUF1990 domain-containing protein n=1 Tax=Deinococcus deserti (strain DSM 17065 / CIP 109153 / LMG 22923 / VCD115) TaxID=546414 RepID=C1D1T1_DEIDV|nr:DUF1990 domain-containing protein [Deinococcus deserti]ACO45805.1 hypothetical protein Deide_09280 [Deinococcus deserti VCD115]